MTIESKNIPQINMNITLFNISIPWLLSGKLKGKISFNHCNFESPPRYKNQIHINSPMKYTLNGFLFEIVGNRGNVCQKCAATNQR